MPVLDDIQAKSVDVLRVEHRSSEPFDHPFNPTDLANVAVTWTVGMVAAIANDGYAALATQAAVIAGTQKPAGLLLLPRNPNDELKNNYVDASGNGSLISSCIVILDTQILEDAVTAPAKLYVSATAGILTTVAPVDAAEAALCFVGWAMSSRTVADADVRFKLEL